MAEQGAPRQTTTAMRILALTRYGDLGPSSRVRMLQYIPQLRARDVGVEVHPFLDNTYVRRLYDGAPPDRSGVLRAFARRIACMRRLRDCATVWVEKEMLPWLPAGLERVLRAGNARLVVDFDDAVHLNYERHPRALVRWLLSDKIARVMRSADCVVAGNRYLAGHAQAQGARAVSFIPSVVDAERYEPAPARERDTLCLGWMGSPVTEPYLHLVADCLSRLARAHAFTLLTVGAVRFAPAGVPLERRRWSLDTEVRDIQDMDIGIMPLFDGPWEQGKCGYKLIQYMACGKAVVASAVGANRDIIRHGVDGLLAATPEEWSAHLDLLIRDGALRRRLGAAARRKVQQEYSVQARVAQLCAVLTGTRS